LTPDPEKMSYFASCFEALASIAQNTITPSKKVGQAITKIIAENAGLKAAAAEAGQDGESVGDQVANTNRNKQTVKHLQTQQTHNNNKDQVATAVKAYFRMFRDVKATEEAYMRCMRKVRASSPHPSA